METHNHTPGPWGRKENESAPYGVKDICDSNGDCIASMDSRGGSASPEEMEANATLIEASPRLLEAMQYIEDILAFHEGSAKPAIGNGRPVIWINGEDHMVMLLKARTAIAKAKGVQP